MAVYSHHESCPHCGSRDNLGRYSDGSGWCFGCHKYYPSTSSSSIHSKNSNGIVRAVDGRLPPDCCKDFPKTIQTWLGKYEITIPEALKWGWVYSPWYNQLIFPFYRTCALDKGREDGETDQDLLFYQARNFNEGRAFKRKYYNQGNPKDILPIFGGPSHGGSESRCLLVVEDCVSAAKIARQSDAMPLLGSYLPARKIVALKTLYDRLVVWLDADKYKEALEISTLSKWLGMETKVVHTKLDPKEYTDDEIRDFLSQGG